MDAAEGVPLERLLRAVHDWPWARPAQLAAYAALSPAYVRDHGGPALLTGGWIEALTLPDEPEARWAPTAAGSALLGRPWDARASAAAWLRAPHLDRARDLVLELAAGARLLWARAPFTLPLGAVYGPPTRRRAPRGRSRLPALQPILADALWAWAAEDRPGPPRYRTAWLWVDPGDVVLDDALGGVLRSLALWRRRREWRAAPGLFPLAVLVAANGERQQRLWRVWRDRLGGEPIALRLCARPDLAQPLARRTWQTERGDRVGWGGGAGPGAPLAPVAPWSTTGRWWGAQQAAVPPRESRRAVVAAAAAQSLRVWCAWQPRAVRGPVAQVAVQRLVTPLGRDLVQTIGHYPLLRARELAVIVGQDPAGVSLQLRALARFRLVRRVLAGGYTLTRLGVDWLAAQYGWSGARYAQLRRWPAYGAAPEQGYSVAALTAMPAHTALVIAFFVGLVRHAAAAGLWLEAFDYRNCWLRRPSAAGARFEEHLIPDGIGRLHDHAGRVVELWLEVDRGTGRGRRLTHKFRRHYLDARGLTRGARGRLVVILVEAGARRRLERLADLIQRLDAALGVHLPVRLARVDQLAADDGLDPTRPVWRDAYHAGLCPLFPDADAAGPR